MGKDGDGENRGLALVATQPLDDATKLRAQQGDGSALLSEVGAQTLNGLGEPVDNALHGSRSLPVTNVAQGALPVDTKTVSEPSEQRLTVRKRERPTPKPPALATTADDIDAAYAAALANPDRHKVNTIDVIKDGKVIARFSLGTAPYKVWRRLPSGAFEYAGLAESFERVSGLYSGSAAVVQPVANQVAVRARRRG